MLLMNLEVTDKMFGLAGMANKDDLCSEILADLRALPVELVQEALQQLKELCAKNTSEAVELLRNNTQLSIAVLYILNKMGIYKLNLDTATGGDEDSSYLSSPTPSNQSLAATLSFETQVSLGLVKSPPQGVHSPLSLAGHLRQHFSQ
jgi:hypothetical protein